MKLLAEDLYVAMWLVFLGNKELSVVVCNREWLVWGWEVVFLKDLFLFGARGRNLRRISFCEDVETSSCCSWCCGGSDGGSGDNNDDGDGGGGNDACDVGGGGECGEDGSISIHSFSSSVWSITEVWLTSRMELLQCARTNKQVCNASSRNPRYLLWSVISV